MDEGFLGIYLLTVASMRTCAARPVVRGRVSLLSVKPCIDPLDVPGQDRPFSDDLGLGLDVLDVGGPPLDLDHMADCELLVRATLYRLGLGLPALVKIDLDRYGIEALGPNGLDVRGHCLPDTPSVDLDGSDLYQYLIKFDLVIDYHLFVAGKFELDPL